jgi:hypothetical protein
MMVVINTIHDDHHQTSVRRNGAAQDPRHVDKGRSNDEKWPLLAG